MPPASSYRWENTHRSTFTIERWSWDLRFWSLVALGLAILFHVWMFYFFSNRELGGRYMPKQAPDKPRFNRIAINPELMKDKQVLKQIPDKIADEPVESHVKADLTELAKMLPEDQPMDLTPSVRKATSFNAPNPQSNTRALAPSLAAVADALPGPDLSTAASSMGGTLLHKAVSASQLMIPQKPLDRELAGLDSGLLEHLHQREAGNGANRTLPGYANLDDLLAHNSPIAAGTKFALPTDLLFDYGSDQLADSARLSLMKLGYLITKNPHSKFIIEGHTDTFGTDGFNMDLSHRRAVAVVQYLVVSLHLTTERIEAVGMGKADLIVRDGTIEQQAPNRRVEIKVRPLR